MAALRAKFLQPAWKNFLNFSTSVAYRQAGYIVLIPEIPDDTPETNPLLRSGVLPEYADVTGQKCFNAIGKLIVEYESGLCRIEEELEEGQKPKSFSAVMAPLERLTASLDAAWCAVRNLHLVNKRSDIIEAYNRLHERVQKAKMKRFTSPALFKAIKEMYFDLDQYADDEKRVIKMYYMEGKFAGLDLDNKAKRKLEAAMLRIKKYSDYFNQNVAEATNAFTQPLDKELIKHFPDHIVPYFAVDRLNPSVGPWRAVLQSPQYELFLQYCTNRVHRWNVFQAYNARCAPSSTSFSNTSCIEEIRSMRRLQAEIFSFENYAELSVSTKMAPSVVGVQSVLETLGKGAAVSSEKEMKSLSEFCAERGFKGTLELWDVAYWQRKQRNHLYKVEDAMEREYFSLPEVLAGLFQLSKALFDITITESRHLKSSWHRDVQAFDIEENGEHVGSFFFDPYRREGKYDGAWMEVARVRSEVLGTVPVACIIANFLQPLGGRPSLLTFNEVNILARKFSHVLLHCLTRARFCDVAGMVDLEWDAVDICPALFEHLLTNQNAISYISHALPKDLHQSLCAARRHMAGTELCRDIYFSALDLDLYSSRDFWMDLVRKNWDLYRPGFRLDKNDQHLCSFSPIITGSYVAGYYSGIWSRMVAADIFAAFEDAGMKDEKQMRDVGKRFRDTILAGTVGSAEAFRQFRGRDPSPVALTRFLQLETPGE